MVLFGLGAALVATAGTSLAEASTEPSAPATAVSSGPMVAGVSLGTFTWALVGFTVLVLGFIAASRSGRRDPQAAQPGLASAGANRSFQPSAHDAQGEPTAAAVIV